MYNHSFGRFGRFGAASLLCSLVDLGAFAFLSWQLPYSEAGVFAATAIARLLSGVCNFLLNRFWVFRRRETLARHMIGYGLLFCAQMVLSAFLVWTLSRLPIPLVLVKILVDAALFLLSYQVQRRVVFRAERGKETAG